MAALGIYVVAADMLAFPSALTKNLPAVKLHPVEFIGSDVSGTVIDGNGEWFNDGRPTELIIRSDRTENGWNRPTDITIRNLRLRGSIRIFGMGRNGEAEDVRASSLRKGHTARAQAAAPTRIVIENVEIYAEQRIPLHLAPGVTEVRVENCKLMGRSSSTGIYLDAESARNVIRGNRFSLRASREMIAVDSSAENIIEGNHFEQPASGGVYLYRNCGEGGTVRHQTPQRNRIIDNMFGPGRTKPRSYGIWLGSRNGRRAYCHLDAGYNFGSSADDRDFANDNVVQGNRFSPNEKRRIRNDGEGNRILP